jgi:hypothetical protein
MVSVIAFIVWVVWYGPACEIACCFATPARFRAGGRA